MIICLILLLPAASSDPPENNPGQIIVLHSVLLRVRFTWHSLLPENRWALTPPFHPYWHKPAVYLCCTIFGVTSTGRYPAPCPAKPGLSSPGPFRSCQPRLHILLCQKRNIRQLIILPQTLFLVHPQIADPTKPYKTAFHTSKQLPPTNSRRIEFFGISSIGTPTK